MDQADELYKNRANGSSAIAEARTAYESLLSNSRGDDLVHIASRICSLNTFDALHFISGNTAKMEMLTACWDGVINKISPDAIGEKKPEFFYWKSYALANYGKLASTLERIKRIKQLMALIEEGKNIDTRYYGGGILRTAAGIRSNPAVRVLGYYDPALALEEIETAIDSDSAPGSDLYGEDFFGNFEIKANVLVALERTAEAKALLTEFLDDLDLENLPEGIEPENNVDIQDIRALLAQMSK